MVGTSRSNLTSLKKKPENVVERNIALLGEVTRYLLTEPHLLDSLPDDFELVILPDDDPALRLYNLELLNAYEQVGKPIVFVRTKVRPSAGIDQVRPSLYVPLAA